MQLTQIDQWNQKKTIEQAINDDIPHHFQSDFLHSFIVFFWSTMSLVVPVHYGKGEASALSRVKELVEHIQLLKIITQVIFHHKKSYEV